MEGLFVILQDMEFYELEFSYFVKLGDHWLCIAALSVIPDVKAIPNDA